MPTFVGFVPGVCSDVLLKVGELGKLPLADLTPVGFDSEMDSHMLRKI